MKCDRCHEREGVAVVQVRRFEVPYRYLCRRCAFLTGFEVCERCGLAWPECMVFTPLCTGCRPRDERVG